MDERRVSSGRLLKAVREAARSEGFISSGDQTHPGPLSKSLTGIIPKEPQGDGRR